jgi:hypothetical protein
VLVELSVMEQRYQAVLAVVQDGWKVTGPLSVQVFIDMASSLLTEDQLGPASRDIVPRITVDRPQAPTAPLKGYKRWERSRPMELC